LDRNKKLEILLKMLLVILIASIFIYNYNLEAARQAGKISGKWYWTFLLEPLAIMALMYYLLIKKRLVKA